MSDEVVTHGIDALSGEGPIWIIIALIIAALVAIVVILAPVLKRHIETRSEVMKQQAEIAAEREKRKTEESKKTADNTAAILASIQENNRVIGTNIEAFNSLMQKVEALTEKERHSDQLMHDVRDTVEKLNAAVENLRVDASLLKGKLND